ncbi:hypothetical protein ACOMHN_022336 [Nucella lapillus]
MEETLENQTRDHYKQSVVLQRTEGSDVQDPQLLRRRSLTIAHLYLTCASLSRTRTRSLTRTVSVQTLPTSHAAQTHGSDCPDQASAASQRQRPKSEYPLRPPKGEILVDADGANRCDPLSQRPKSERPRSGVRRGFSLERPQREPATKEEVAPSVRPRTGGVSFDTDGGNYSETSWLTQRQRPKSEHPVRASRRGFSVERPQQEHPVRASRRGLSVERPQQEQATKEETVPPVVHRPRVRFERPKSEHHSRRPLLEYRDVIFRESDRKRVVPRRPRSERPDAGCTDSQTRTSRRKP